MIIVDILVRTIDEYVNSIQGCHNKLLTIAGKLEITNSPYAHKINRVIHIDQIIYNNLLLETFLIRDKSPKLYKGQFSKGFIEHVHTVCVETFAKAILSREGVRLLNQD